MAPGVPAPGAGAGTEPERDCPSIVLVRQSPGRGRVGTGCAQWLLCKHSPVWVTRCRLASLFNHVPGNRTMQVVILLFLAEISYITVGQIHGPTPLVLAIVTLKMTCRFLCPLHGHASMSAGSRQ